MKILIVDDNANNRMILNLLLQEHEAQHKSGPYEIQECENGYAALKEVEQKKFDLILMDIMMPEMDGIEATRRIREINKEVMIIAVSAVDDTDKQKEILRNGAEDYIHKPIDAQQLFSRLDNYLSIVPLRSRESVSKNTKAVNLFTHDVFHRQTIFYAENEEALAEFWEYYLLDAESMKVDNLCDVVRAVFSLGENIIRSGAKPWIIVEANKDNLYFTLNRLDVIDKKLPALLMMKNHEIEEYKQSDDRISFRLEKKISQMEVCAAGLKPEGPAISVSIATQDDTKGTAILTTPSVEIERTDATRYKVYNYMDPDDLSETEELLDELSSLMLMLGNSSLEISEIDQISSYLSELGKRLSIYTESYAIGIALSSLSQEILTYKERFQEIASDLSTLSSAFTSDLQSWLRLTFYKGAPSVDFMNDTIIVNCETISAMLHVDESTENHADLDDIFDF